MQNKNGRRWWRTAVFLSIVAIGICAILIALWLLPSVVVDMDAHDGKPLEGAARQTAIAAVRQVILFCAGGLIAIVTLTFTWRRDQITRASADLAQDANYTTRYTEAIKQLGDDSVAIRLGGIYALERIAADSSRDRQTILDVLTSHLRFESPRRKGADDEQETDVGIATRAAALVVSRISQMSPPEYPIDLSMTHLPSVDLRGANLIGANLFGANLSQARLDRASLLHAKLTLANFASAQLSGANLAYARLRTANLSSANLEDANLIGADLNESTLRRTRLVGANLEAATLHSVDLTGAKLTGANLDETEFADVTYDRTTRWPPIFDPPSSRG